jgi:hypothetical protein
VPPALVQGQTLVIDGLPGPSNPLDP